MNPSQQHAATGWVSNPVKVPVCSEPNCETKPFGFAEYVNDDGYRLCGNCFKRLGGLQPLMYPDEVTALQATVDALPEAAVIVEFGSGGSTRFFADNLQAARRLVSIEHNAEWYETVSIALDQHPNRERITLIYAGPELPLSRYIFAMPEEEMPAGLARYIHPETPVSWSDVTCVLVDGVARGACLAALRTKLRPGTTVLLHDYTGREYWYDWAVSLYDRVSLTNTLLTLRVPENN